MPPCTTMEYTTVVQHSGTARFSNDGSTPSNRKNRTHKDRNSKDSKRGFCLSQDEQSINAKEEKHSSRRSIRPDTSTLCMTSRRGTKRMSTRFSVSVSIASQSEKRNSLELLTKKRRSKRSTAMPLNARYKPPQKEYGSEELVLTKNSLEYIPDSLCKLTRLTTLELSDNTIQALPDEFGNLKKLKAGVFVYQLSVEGMWRVIFMHIVLHVLVMPLAPRTRKWGVVLCRNVEIHAHCFACVGHAITPASTNP